MAMSELESTPPLWQKAKGTSAPDLTAFVVHGTVGYGEEVGTGGFDELTPFGPAVGFALDRGQVAPLNIDPREFGIPGHDPDQVRVADKPAALKAIQDVLTGKANAAMQDMTALNLGAALHLVTGRTLAECMREARQAVADGAAEGFANAGK